MYHAGQNLNNTVVTTLLAIFLTNAIGIAATTVGFLFLVIKFWDAVNDPIFGVIIDKVHLKKGKFLPWIRLSAILLPVATVILFFCPASLAEWLKVLWVALGYMLWDASFTFNDAPIQAIPLAMTDNTKERNFLIFLNRCISPAGSLMAVAVPLMSDRMGYGPAVLIVSVIALILMLPFGHIGKERYPVRSEESPSIKSMLLYVRHNKPLMIYILAEFIKSVMNFIYALMMYVAVYNLRSSGLMSLTLVLITIPTILGLLTQLTLFKNTDKFTSYVRFTVMGILVTVIMYFVGYKSLTAFMVLFGLQAFFIAISNNIKFAFVADCTIYGTYKTGTHAEGVSFAILVFLSKISQAIPGVLSMFILGILGFISSSGGFPEQPQAVVDGIWILFTWVSAIAFLLQLLIMLLFYPLRDKNVKIMSDCNNGLISREEAEKLLPANL
jgi:Na+/melibiose symporter-like transporter